MKKGFKKKIIIFVCCGLVIISSLFIILLSLNDFKVRLPARAFSSALTLFYGEEIRAGRMEIDFKTSPEIFIRDLKVSDIAFLHETRLKISFKSLLLLRFKEASLLITNPKIYIKKKWSDETSGMKFGFFPASWIIRGGEVVSTKNKKVLFDHVELYGNYGIFTARGELASQENALVRGTADIKPDRISARVEIDSFDPAILNNLLETSGLSGMVNVRTFIEWEAQKGLNTSGQIVWHDYPFIRDSSDAQDKDDFDIDWDIFIDDTGIRFDNFSMRLGDKLIVLKDTKGKGMPLEFSLGHLPYRLLVPFVPFGLINPILEELICDRIRSGFINVHSVRIMPRTDSRSKIWQRLSITAGLEDMVYDQGNGSPLAYNIKGDLTYCDGDLRIFNISGITEKSVVEKVDLYFGKLAEETSCFSVKASGNMDALEGWYVLGSWEMPEVLSKIKGTLNDPEGRLAINLNIDGPMAGDGIIEFGVDLSFENMSLNVGGLENRIEKINGPLKINTNGGGWRDVTLNISGLPFITTGMLGGFQKERGFFKGSLEVPSKDIGFSFMDNIFALKGDKLVLAFSGDADFDMFCINELKMEQPKSGIIVRDIKFKTDKLLSLSIPKQSIEPSAFNVTSSNGLAGDFTGKIDTELYFKFDSSLKRPLINGFVEFDDFSFYSSSNIGIDGIIYFKGFSADATGINLKKDKGKAIIDITSSDIFQDTIYYQITGSNIDLSPVSYESSLFDKIKGVFSVVDSFDGIINLAGGHIGLLPYDDLKLSSKINKSDITVPSFFIRMPYGKVSAGYAAKQYPNVKRNININSNFSKMPLREFKSFFNIEPKDADGTVDLRAVLNADASGNETLIDNLNGKANIRFNDIRLSKYGVISKIFTVLNPYRIFRGGLKNITEKGYPVNCFKANVEIKDGVADIPGFYMESPSLQASGLGKFLIKERQLDIKAGFQPLETIDKGIGALPFVGWLLTDDEKRLLVVYLHIYGQSDDLNVVPEPIKSIGAPVFNIIGNILKTPKSFVDWIIDN